MGVRVHSEGLVLFASTSSVSSSLFLSMLLLSPRGFGEKVRTDGIGEAAMMSVSFSPVLATLAILSRSRISKSSAGCGGHVIASVF